MGNVDSEFAGTESQRSSGNVQELLSFSNDSTFQTWGSMTFLEPKMRIELTTYALRVRCSTPELPGRVALSLPPMVGPSS